MPFYAYENMVSNYSRVHRDGPVGSTRTSTTARSTMSRSTRVRPELTRTQTGSPGTWSAGTWSWSGLKGSQALTGGSRVNAELLMIHQTWLDRELSCRSSFWTCSQMLN